MARDETIRFAVGSERGPRSASFRAWRAANHSDVYFAVRAIGGEIKVSLHESGSWQWGFTSQSSAPGQIGMAQRHVDIWQRPEPLDPGVTLAMRLRVPPLGLSAETAETYRQDTVWVPPPTDAEHIEFRFWLLARDRELAFGSEPGIKAGPVGSFDLPNEERFEISWHREALVPLQAGTGRATMLNGHKLEEDQRYGAFVDCGYDDRGVAVFLSQFVEYGGARTDP